MVQGELEQMKPQAGGSGFSARGLGLGGLGCRV